MLNIGIGIGPEFPNRCIPNQYLTKPTSIWNIFPQLVFSQLGGIHFLCNYNISKLPIKLSFIIKFFSMGSNL